MVYDGPWVIVDKLNEQDYRVQMDKGGKQVVIHHDKLKPYRGLNYPAWGNKIKKSVPGLTGSMRV